MRKHIEKLKQQHPRVRTRAALMMTTGITAIVGLIWVTTLPVRFGEALSATGGANATAGALSAFGDMVAPEANQIKDAFSGTPTSVSGLEVTENPTDGSAPNTNNRTGSSPTESYLPPGLEGDSGARVDSSSTSGY